MRQGSPGVERAVEAAKLWAERLGASHVRPVDLVLALLDEEEGRPALLLEGLGLDVADVRKTLIERASLSDPPAANTDQLFATAREWSFTYREDASFTTDAFLLVVVRCEPHFHEVAASLGFASHHLEPLLVGPLPEREVHDSPPVDFAPTFEPENFNAARILDVNLNRARESLRILDDYCRFVLNDRFLTEYVKSFRHELAVMSQLIPPSLLLSARETQHDVGTDVTASGEYERASTPAVAAINLKRLQESLRSLEEYGKVLNPNLGREFEPLRYRAYTLERALVLGAASRERLRSALLYLLVSGSSCHAALHWTIQQAAAGGVDIVQLREKSLSDKELLARAHEVRRWTRECRVLFIVNDRPDIARLVEADGVHLGQDDMPVMEARKILGPNALIGVSTHSLDQVRQAVLDGADYIGIGPTFPSKTKEFDVFPGLEFVRAASAETSLPAFVLGGISAENVAEVAAAGGRRIAVSAAISQADDPEQAARILRAALNL
jgi:thiamine-phosphate pyrophosphorylase